MIHSRTDHLSAASGAPLAAAAPRGSRLRFLSPRLHGLVDYAAAAGLVFLPLVLPLGGRNPLEIGLSIGAGIGLLLYSLVTDYPYALARRISFRGHLLLDAIAGTAFLVLPSLLDFGAFARLYYAANGLAVLAAVAVSDASADDR